MPLIEPVRMAALLIALAGCGSGTAPPAADAAATGEVDAADAAAPGEVQGADTAGEVGDTTMGCATGTSEPATLDTGTGVLAGTLVLPAGCEPHPVALIHAGSGPTDRDGNSAGIPGRNDSLKMLAEALAARGIASLRYDKRGIGASKAAGPADERDYHFSTLVADATAWAARLAADPRFSSVTIIGHSEGSLIAMLAAAKSPTRAVVSIAGAGRPAGTVLREQLARQLSGDLLASANHIIDELEQGRPVAAVPPELMALFRPSVQPYLIEWFAYDPARELSDANLPALVAQGTTDLQVTEEDARLLAADRPTTIVLLVPGMNHVLKRVSGDAQAQAPSYGDPTLPIVPELPEAIARFIASPP